METSSNFKFGNYTLLSWVEDVSPWLRQLDPRQRTALALFRDSNTITSRDVESLFSISQRMAHLLLKRWAESGFLVAVDPARKSRKYALNEPGQQFAGRVTP